MLTRCSEQANPNPRAAGSVAGRSGPLSRLQEAAAAFDEQVKARNAQLAFAAAAKLPPLIAGFEPNDPNNAAALNDALDRLRKNLKALLGAAKDCLGTGTPAQDALFDKLMDEFLRNAALADQIARGDLSGLSTVQTGLVRSGMIEAAAEAARMLQKTFED